MRTFILSFRYFSRGFCIFNLFMQFILPFIYYFVHLSIHWNYTTVSFYSVIHKNVCPILYLLTFILSFRYFLTTYRITNSFLFLIYLFNFFNHSSIFHSFIYKFITYHHNSANNFLFTHAYNIFFSISSYSQLLFFYVFSEIIHFFIYLFTSFTDLFIPYSFIY